MARSKFKIQPVVDMIVSAATRLCQAEDGAFNIIEPGGFRLLLTTVGTIGDVSQGLVGKLVPLDRGSVTGRVALESRVVHVHDVQADPEFTLMRGTAGDMRRTMLGVPLVKDGLVMGALILYRRVVYPFTERQIELVPPSSPSRTHGRSKPSRRDRASSRSHSSSRRRPASCLR